MFTELNPIIDFLNYITKPENLPLTISIITIVVTLLGIGVKILMYLLERRTIPKLVFDGIWKEPNYKGTITCYYIKVKRNKGGTQEVMDKLRMEVGKRMGAKRGNLTEAIKEAIEIWIKSDKIKKLKESIENSGSSGSNYNDMIDALKLQRQDAMPALIDIMDSQINAENKNYTAKAIKELAERKS